MEELDHQIFLILNGMRHPFADTFMWLYSSKIIWVPLYCSLAWLLYKCYGLKMALILLTAIILCVTITDMECARLFRPLLARPRPAADESELRHLVHLVNDYRGGRYGFPSCHAANSFCLSTAMMLTVRIYKLSIFLLIWALLTCYSRIYLGVHFPGDLMLGALIGTINAVITMTCCHKYLNPGSVMTRPTPLAVTLPIIIGAVTIAITLSSLIRL